MPQRPDDVVPPFVLASTINWLIEQVNQLNGVTADGAEIDRSAGNPILRVRHPEVGFKARVVRSGADEPAKYDWWQQRYLGQGEYEDDPYGRTGTADDPDDPQPAYSIPPDAVIEDDAIVWMTRDYAAITTGGSGNVVEQQWAFFAGAAAPPWNSTPCLDTDVLLNCNPDAEQSALLGRCLCLETVAGEPRWIARKKSDPTDDPIDVTGDCGE